VRFQPLGCLSLQKILLNRRLKRSIEQKQTGDGAMTKIKDGDQVLFYLDARRNWLRKVEAGGSFHLHRGILNFDEVIGQEYGSLIATSLGVRVAAVPPLPRDRAVKMGRQTNIVYPKDAGLILLLAGIGPGSQVIEAGTGSGALASLLGYHVSPTGHVYSYEIRDDFAKVAQKNLKKVGLDELVTVKQQDILEGIAETNVDAVVLDMAVPWEVVPMAYAALKGGGVFVSFSPTIEQTQQTVEALYTSHFTEISTRELIEREILVRKGKTRPATRMIGHTGYVTSARKVYPPFSKKPD
jgi:tRNA (adenine57-N1/adenine58-N1)-methyltransferase